MTGVIVLSFTGCGGSNPPPAPRPTLTVTAADASRGYGAANPTFTASATGALPSDTFTFTASTVAAQSSAAGTYPIVPAVTGANLANYNVVYVNGALTVNKAILTVTPNNQNVVVGSIPLLTATITGFVNGDPPTVVTGLPALTTTATSYSPAGSYPITASLGLLPPPITALPSGLALSPSFQRTIPVSASLAVRWPEANPSFSHSSSSTLLVPPATAPPVPIL